MTVKFTNAFVRRLEHRSGRPWQGTLKYRDQGGKWRQKTRIFDRDLVKTKSQAQAALADWKAEEERREAVPDASVPVADYIRAFIEGLASTGAIEASTATDYGYSLKHIEHGFPDVRLCDLRADEVQAWELGMMKDGLGSSTVGKAHRLLKMACTRAVEFDHIARNPCAPVRPPKRGRVTPNALDEAGQAKCLKLLDSMERTPVVIMAHLALLAGLRCGEACALQWKDVDLKGATINVRQSVGRANGGTYLKTTKNASSMRTVPIHSDLVNALKERREAVWREWAPVRLYLNAPATEEAFSGLYVCGDLEGKYGNPTVLGKQWSSIAKSAGLVGTSGKVVTAHGLRHTYATAAVAAGTDIRSVSANLGHASAALTLDVYASALPEAQRRTADIVGDALRRAADNAKPADVTEFRRVV